MFCHKCGTNLAADSSFCSNCGAMVAETESAQTQPPKTATNFTNEPFGNGQTYTEVPPNQTPPRKPGSRRIEGLKVASGVVSIVWATVSLFDVIVGIVPMDVPFTFTYALLTVAFTVFAVYTFAFYGKKRSKHFIIALSLFAGAHLINAVNNIGISAINLTIGLMLDVSISVIITIIAAKYSRESKAISKGLPIALSSLAGVLLIFTYLQTFQSAPVRSGGGLFGIENHYYEPIFFIYYIPFLLFLFGCPPEHKRLPK